MTHGTSGSSRHAGLENEDSVTPERNVRRKRNASGNTKCKSSPGYCCSQELVLCCSSSLGKLDCWENVLGRRLCLDHQNTGGSNLPTEHIQCAHCDAWMSSNSALWRRCKRFHQDLAVEAYPRCPEQEESDSDAFGLGRECPSDSGHDESPERSMAEFFSAA